LRLITGREATIVNKSSAQNAIWTAHRGVYKFMIRRVGFRRLLPLTFTLVHLLLVLYAATHQPSRLSGIPRQSAYRVVEYQEDPGVPWHPIPEPRPLTAVEKVAILLNLPAVLAAIPIAAVFFRGSDLGSLYASVPFVPLVWYCIGRWLDGLLGYVARSHVVPRVWSGLFAVLSTGLLTISVLTVTPPNHHRTNDYWVGTALVAWSGLFLAICLSSFYRRPSN
jgi:hypothetical protein